VNGDARSYLKSDITPGEGIAAFAAGFAALLGAVAVYSPKEAVLALFAAGFVALAMTKMPLGIAIFIVLTFPAHLPGSLGAGATLAKPVGGLLVFAWLATVLTRRATHALLPHEQPLLFSAVVGLLLFGSVSVLWAAEAGETHSALGRFLLNAALLLVTYTAASTRSGFRTIVHGYVFASVVTSSYSLASGHYIASGRLGGLFDPNYFAAELIPAIVIACFLLVTTASVRIRWLFAAVAVIDLAAFALTQSRGGIVGLGVALLMAVVVAGRARPRILALVLVLVAGGVGYYFGYKPAHVFQGGSRAGLAGTTSGRLDEWQVALRVFSGHPVGGVGLGNYQVVEPSYATQDLNLSVVRQIVTDRLVVHNTYLQIAAELGLVGLCLFIAILAVPLRMAGRALARLDQTLGELEFEVRGLLAGTFGLLVAYFFISGEFEKPLWLVLALLASVPAVLRPEGPAS
jgi:putative inorganic carbon (HCO3(-)) transporter